MTPGMQRGRLDFEKITVALAIPIILLIATASALMFFGAVKDNEFLKSLGTYSSIPILVWTAAPLLAALSVVLGAVFRKAVRIFKPLAFPSEIAAPLEYVPKAQTATERNEKGSMSDEQILRLLLRYPFEPSTGPSNIERVDWSASDQAVALSDDVESVIPPESGVKVVEVPRHADTLETNSEFEQVCVGNLRKPGDAKLVLMWRSVNEAMFVPICDFLHRVITGALDVGPELKERLRIFIPWRDRDNLIQELWRRLLADKVAMLRLGAEDAYQLLAIVMKMCLLVPKPV